MSSHEPLWFCHECHKEMRPLMVPDPVCAECRGSFVEKMEDSTDDPRQFFNEGNDEFGDNYPPGMNSFFVTLQSLLDEGLRPNGGPSQVTFEVRPPSTSRSARPNNSNSIFGGARSDSPTGMPRFPTYLGNRGPSRRDRDISGPLMAQYLMALLGRNDQLFSHLPENGRMGDYVFNQEELDRIISQIMENSNAHRPVPATDEIITKLPREVLIEGSPLLEHDCAVCKDQFKLGTDDPDEQIVVTLPCSHPFHEPCITPWLKSSGTCPVCRHALVPQPEQHPSPGQGPDSGGGGGRRSQRHQRGGSGSSSGPPGPGSGGEGFLHNLFSNFGHTQNDYHSHSGRNGRPLSPQSHYRSSPPHVHPRRSSSDPQSHTPRSPRGSDRRPPNGNSHNNHWLDDVD